MRVIHGSAGLANPPLPKGWPSGSYGFGLEKVYCRALGAWGKRVCSFQEFGSKVSGKMVSIVLPIESLLVL